MCIEEPASSKRRWLACRQKSLGGVLPLKRTSVSCERFQHRDHWGRFEVDDHDSEPEASAWLRADANCNIL